MEMRARRIDDATKRFEGARCRPANLEHPRLARSMPLEVRAPGNAFALERTLQPPLKRGAIAFERQRHARIEARLHREQHGKIRVVSGPGNADTHGLQPRVASSAGNEANPGAKA